MFKMFFFAVAVVVLLVSGCGDVGDIIGDPGLTQSDLDTLETQAIRADQENSAYVGRGGNNYLVTLPSSTANVTAVGVKDTTNNYVYQGMKVMLDGRTHWIVPAPSINGLILLVNGNVTIYKTIIVTPPPPDDTIPPTGNQIYFTNFDIAGTPQENLATPLAFSWQRLTDPNGSVSISGSAAKISSMAGRTAARVITTLNPGAYIFRVTSASNQALELLEMWVKDKNANHNWIARKFIEGPFTVGQIFELSVTVTTAETGHRLQFEFIVKNGELSIDKLEIIKL